MIEANSVISILVWNHPDYVKNLLDSLLRYKISRYPYEIFIVDQNSNKQTKDILNQTQLPFHLIALEENIGFSKGHNLVRNEAGLRYSFDYLCLINSDIIFEEDYWLDKLNDGLNESNLNAIAGPVGFKINLSKEGYCYGVTANDDEMRCSGFDGISGSLFSVKMDVVNKLDLFDEIFTPAYFEDADLNLRYKLHGYKLVYVPIKHQHDYLNIKTHEERLKNKELLLNFGDYYRNNMEVFVKRWGPVNYLKKSNSSKMVKTLKRIYSVIKSKF